MLLSNENSMSDYESSIIIQTKIEKNDEIKKLSVFDKINRSFLTDNVCSIENITGISGTF